MEGLARQALRAWDIPVKDVSLVAQRENTVFRVTDGADHVYALRLHRPGYQTAQAIRSELQWMAWLSASGITVPEPIPTRSGEVLAEVQGCYTDLLTWLPGRPLGATGEALEVADRPGTFRQIGHLLAQVHAASDDWTVPSGFERPAWDAEGVLGETPLWDRFWSNPGLTTEQRALFQQVRETARDVLEREDLDYGLIHADMVRENLLVSDTGLALIDFDDSGFGYRLFDIATALIKNRSEPDFPALKAALIHGYCALRPLDLSFLPMFMALRALTYVGWIISRIKEPGAEIRQRRFVQAAVTLSQEFLSGHGR